jgi:hypothetical protein
MKKFILILPVLIPMLTMAQVPVIEYEEDGYHAKPWEPIAQNNMSEQSQNIAKELEGKRQRLAQFERDFEIVSALITNHDGIWNKKQYDAALWAFCFAKMDDDILYQLMIMGQRHDTVKNEIERLMNSLKQQIEDGERVLSMQEIE